MTSPSRRKRPTTARASSTGGTTASRRAALWGAGLALLLAAAPAPAQVYTPVSSGPARTDPVWTPASSQLHASRTTSAPAPAPRAAQQPPVVPRQPAGAVPPPEEALPPQITVDPPGPERLFRLESEANLLERIRQQGRQLRQQDADLFPEEVTLATGPYPGRHWPPSQRLVEPGYVCYQKLLFEQRNTERFGWDLGMVQPFMSAGEFFFDFVTLPYHAASRPCCCFDCSSGYCLPGDPVPYLLYPPEISLTGAIAEVGTVVAMFAIFP